MRLTVELPKEFAGQLSIPANVPLMKHLGAEVSYVDDGAARIVFPEEAEIRWTLGGGVVNVLLNNHKGHGRWSFEAEHVLSEL